MSYSGEIQAAGVFALAMYAARSVSRAATAGIRAARDAQQTRMLRQMRSRLASLTGDAVKVSADLGTSLSAVAAQCHAEYAQTVAALTASCEKTPDIAGFLRECDRARAELYRHIEEQRESLESGAVAAVRDAMRRSQVILRHERQETALSMQQIADDQKRRSRAGDLAREIITETAAMLADLRDVWGKAASADACAALLRRAEELAAQELPEAALTAAYAAQDAVLTRVTELMTAEIRTRQLHAEVMQALESAQTVLLERSTVFCFAQTRTGVPAEKEIPDLPHYFRGDWETLEQELHLLSQLPADPLDCDPQSLADQLDRLNDWQSRFARAHACAVSRIHNELLRQETGRLLAKRWMAQGYRLLPLTAEERAVSPLDSLILRLGHPETGAELEFRLNAVQDADGNIAMQILTEDHTPYPGTDAQIEAARQSVREDTCDAIRESGIGQGMQLRQRCRNPGVRDDFQRP